MHNKFNTIYELWNKIVSKDHSLSAVREKWNGELAYESK